MDRMHEEGALCGFAGGLVGGVGVVVAVPGAAVAVVCARAVARVAAGARGAVAQVRVVAVARPNRHEPEHVVGRVGVESVASGWRDVAVEVVEDARLCCCCHQHCHRCCAEVATDLLWRWRDC